MNPFKNLWLKAVVTLGDKILDADYLNSLYSWIKYDKLSTEKLDDLERNNLCKILKHTVETVPYYLKYFNNTKPTCLKDFPILTKEILREEKENLISNKYKIDSLVKNYSSGSSGIQSFSYADRAHKFYTQGIHSHWYMWTGYKIGDSILQFGMSPNRVFPKNLKDLFYNVYYVNSFSLDEQKILKIAENAIHKKVKYIIGYPSAINQFASVLIKNNINIPINGIISLGDKLFDHFKNNFNLAFSSPKIIDTYGCAEGILIACTNDLEYYYIMSPNVTLEIVDNEGNEVPDGALGNVLVTSHTLFAMPLIRYKLGDLAIKLPKSEYPPNRQFNYPLLQKIVGRETDVVLTPDGKTLIVHSFTGIVEFFPEIKQFRIIQEYLDSIIFEYITDNFFKFDESVLYRIQEKIDSITEKSIKIIFKKVDYINPTPSGKPQIIESKLIKK